MFPSQSAAALALMILVAVSPVSQAPAATDPNAVVTDFGNRMLTMLDQPQASAQDRQRQFAALLDQDFDFQAISRFVLGRYWKTATDAEKAQFAAVFKDYVVQSYSKRFDEFKGSSFKVVGIRAESDTSSVVRTTVMRPAGGQPANVDWRVAKEGDGYKITEVSIEGISMSLTHRDEFASIMERNGGSVSDLIAQIRRKTST